MRNLSEYKDEEALDLLAELFEPMTSFFLDDEFVKTFDSGNRLGAVKIAIKNHKPEVMQILAAMEGVPVEEYHCNVMTLPIRLYQLITTPEIAGFFTSVKEKNSEKSSGSVTGNTGESEA